MRAVGLLVILVLFVGLPLLLRTWGVAARLVRRLRVPLPSLVALPLVLIGIAFMAGPRLLAGSKLFVLDGVGELFVSAAWLVFAVTAVSWTDDEPLPRDPSDAALVPLDDGWTSGGVGVMTTRSAQATRPVRSRTKTA